MDSSHVAVIETTFSSRFDAEKIAQELLIQRKLAACCHIYPSVQSLYMWQNKLCREEEVVLRVKTTKEAAYEACRAIRELHPYQNPEVIVTFCDIVGSIAYEKWLEGQTKIN